ncbi:tyrosine-type recombinase/integrase [Candidatus Bathyarchaeota archaeon A05DMB-2]|jgi:integrase|nr:tyrosine-type recombinase/integrase [Candidatus Bathyarchaeota archaeon A05DMB-2]MCR4437374.1 tyrosine-type recombinase/integrase [Eubacteriales bacterium]
MYEVFPAQLPEQVEKARKLMKEKGYAERTVENYRGVWHHLLKYANSEGITLCTDELTTQFARLRYGIEDIFHPIGDREKYYARILLCLYDLSIKDLWIMQRTYGRVRQFKTKSFAAAYDSYTAWLSGKTLKQGSISLKQQIIRKFLYFAEDEQISDISELNQTIILKYLESKSGLSTSTKSGIIITLRDFFKCPEIAGIVGKDLSVNLKVVNNSKYQHLPSIYSVDEIKRILAVIDRKTLEGKKDYAVILLAVDTGLRISDIINLRLGDLKWDCHTIEIIQQKTGEFLQTSMTDALKWALLDYLMNARPKSTAFDHVFLRSLAPFSPYISAGHYYKRLNKYFELAGVNRDGKHHGMHTLRHSLAARLMGDNVPITVISEALGHKYANVTMQYVRIDIEKLRLAALGVPSNV